MGMGGGLSQLAKAETFPPRGGVGEPMSLLAWKAMDPGAWRRLSGIHLLWNLHSVCEHRVPTI